MKKIKKSIIGIIFIFIFLQLLSKYSYGITGWNNNISSYVKPQPTAVSIYSIDEIHEETKWNACIQHRGVGYSYSIIGVYETIWSKEAGKIIANSVNDSGVRIDGSSHKLIRNLAASMHLDANIDGVRNALRRCVSSSEVSVAPSELIAGSKYQVDEDGGEDMEWQQLNRDTRLKYMNYRTLQTVSGYESGTAKKVKVSGQSYYKIGPFKMKFGTAKINDITVNGTSVKGTGTTKYVVEGSSEVKYNFNELKEEDNPNLFYINEKVFYVLIKEDTFKSLVKGSTVTIKFYQNDFSYKRGRAFVCNNASQGQASLWYINKSAVATGGVAKFTAKVTDTIDIVVKKVWDDNNSNSRPTSVKVKISAGGAVINSAGKTSLTKTITSSGSVTFSNLKRTDDDGNLLEYKVQEIVPDGYTASYTAKTLKVKEGKYVYTTTITNKKDGESVEITPDVGELLVTKEGGNMSFRVWEDSPAQWIKSSSGKSYGEGRSVPSDQLTGASYSDKSKIDAGTKLGSYVYKYYTVYSSETRYDTHYYTYYVYEEDEEGNEVKVPKTGSYQTSYTYYYYYSITDNVQCVHIETHAWLGSYKTVEGQYKISGLYPGTYEIYETDCDKYYDLELQSGYSENGYHGVSNIRLASTASLSANSSKTVKLGLPSSTRVHNDKTRGDLEIEKTYETGEPIDEIKIAIYGEVNEGNYHYSGWLTTAGSYEGVKWSSIGSIFTGSINNPYITEEGQISITGLPVGTYKIYEIKTKSIEYALEGQGSYDGEKTLLGTVTISRNTTSTIQVTYIQKKREKGDITIDKTGIYVNNNLSSPNVTEKLNNVSFILKSNATDKGGWKNGIYVYIRANEKGEDIIDFTSNKDEATIFTTDSNGKVTISGLYQDLGPYEIEEIENEDQDKYYTDPIIVRGDTTSNAPSTASIKNLRSSGDLRIEKVDENYHDLKLSGGKFKLKLVSSEYLSVSNMWIGGSGYEYFYDENTYDYSDFKHNEYLVSSVSDAMEFETNSNGEINIKKIINGTYEVYETATPKGYDITKQDGYDSNTKMVYRGTVTISTNNNVVNYQVVNKKVVNKLDGFVWVDEKDSKLNTYNSLYKDNNENDYLKEGIQVNLVDKNTGKVRASTVTDKNGYYEFTRYSDGSYIIYWDLAHSYVEYIYNNKIIYNDNGTVKEYGFVVVNPFAGGKDKISINSKAQAKEITKDELFDDNLTGTKDPYPGRAVTYTSTSELGFSQILKQNEEVTTKDNNKNTDTFLEEKLITSYYDEDKFVIENINLGLVEKNETTHAIDESIEYVKIVKGDYTFTYEYGEEAKTEEGEKVSTVKFQNSSKTFTQNIYPSDIKYNLANEFSDNDPNKFRVYVVYRIDVKNTTTINNSDLYVEKGLYLDNLINEYDSSRFELSSDVLDGDKQNISDDFALWKNVEDGDDTKASFDINVSNKKYKLGNDGIEPNGVESTYIQFKVTDNALNQLLEKEDLEHAPTTSTSYGYHIYTRDDKNWKDKDTYTHKTIQETRSDSALYLKWHLVTTRTISGTVFEDSKDNSREDERVGDGKYSADNEKTLTGVFVSLIDANTGEIAPLYNGDYSEDRTTGKWTSVKQIGRIEVNEDGTYELKGVVPGKYYLQFTYGDGTVNYKALDGTDMSESVKTKINGNTETIRSNYYKSTIITGSAKDATEDNARTWFLGSIKEGVNSVASDYTGTYYDANGNIVGDKNTSMVESRTTSDRELNYTTSQDTVVINARTPLMDVQFEDYNQTQIFYNNVGELPQNCTGMNFGIIERPRIDIQLNKEIKNIKLTLSNGTTVINGNPSKQNVSNYLAVMNKAYSKIEISSDYLYGSDLTITYKITVTNESEVDYSTERYYKYGETSSDSIVKTAVTKIVDYLSYNGGTYKEQDKKDIVKELNEGEEDCKEETYFNLDLVKENNSKYAKKYLITNQDKELIPTKADDDNKKKSSVEYIVTVSRLISSATEDDAGLDNFSEIIGIKNVTFSPQYYSTSGNYKAGDYVSIRNGGTSEDDNANATIVVTPPTGENRSYTIYIIAGISLIVIAGGVIIIKKFVL